MLTLTAAETLWREDLSAETKNFLLKLLYTSSKMQDDTLVQTIERLPPVQRELAGLYLLTRTVEKNIQNLMVKERQRILAEFELRQRAKIRPPDPRLHVHVGRDEDCRFCRQN